LSKKSKQKIADLVRQFLTRHERRQRNI